MAVVISGSLVLSDSASGGGIINANNPLIGYDNLVTSSNVTATTEDADYPASNVANPSTALRWQGAGGSPSEDDYLTFALDTAELVDYLAVARHNFYSAQIAVSVEVLDADASPDTWDEIVSPVIPPSDGPLLFRFTPQAITSIRIRMQPGSAAPRAAVVYSGVLLVLQRRIYVGHTPVNYSDQLSVANHRSISGDFLGRIVLGRKTSTQIALQNLTPAWYRTYLEPFRAAAQEIPFFFAWRPSAYPYEVGFVWTTDDPRPENQLPNGMMSFSMDVEGVT
jgi:hypothetical protein